MLKGLELKRFGATLSRVYCTLFHELNVYQSIDSGGKAAYYPALAHYRGIALW